MDFITGLPLTQHGHDSIWIIVYRLTKSTHFIPVNTMYLVLKAHFWWTKMKKEIAAYVARCDNCSRVKAVHLKSTGLLQPLSIPGWKWDKISMNFIVGLPTTQKGFDSIWVIVDRWTKSAHFIPMRTNYRSH